MTDLRATLEADLADAERKAWDSLARYKFFMFGYHAADVVKINRRLGRRGNPFKTLVHYARERVRTVRIVEADLAAELRNIDGG